MKKSINSLLAGVVMVAFAQAASATCTSCDTQQPANSNTISLTNNVTANPVSNSSAVANPVANGGTSNSTSNATLTGGNNTAILTGGDNTATGGESNASATVQSGAVQLNQTYKQVKQVASAVAAPAMPANVAPGNCWQVTQGASLALQSANWGVSGNMSGKAEWTADSEKCEKAQQIRTGIASPNPAMNAAAILMKGDDALIQNLMGPKGQDLKNFFGTTAQATQVSFETKVAAPAPTEAPVYICPKGTAKAGQAGEVVQRKDGSLALNCGM